MFMCCFTCEEDGLKERVKLNSGKLQALSSSLRDLVCSVGDGRKDFLKDLYHFIKKSLHEKSVTTPAQPPTAANVLHKLEEVLIEILFGTVSGQ